MNKKWFVVLSFILKRIKLTREYFVWERSPVIRFMDEKKAYIFQVVSYNCYSNATLLANAYKTVQVQPPEKSLFNHQ